MDCVDCAKSTKVWNQNLPSCLEYAGCALLVSMQQQLASEVISPEMVKLLRRGLESTLSDEACDEVERRWYREIMQEILPTLVKMINEAIFWCPLSYPTFTKLDFKTKLTFEDMCTKFIEDQKHADVCVGHVDKGDDDG